MVRVKKGYDYGYKISVRDRVKIKVSTWVSRLRTRLLGLGLESRVWVLPKLRLI